MIAILTEIHQHGYHSTDILEAAGLCLVLGTYTLNKAFLLVGTLEEESAAKKVLRAAAFTYVVAVLSAAISFLRLLAIAQSNRRR